jgi:hypothetical protein
MSQAYLDHVVKSFRRHQVSVLITSLCLGTLAPSANEAYYRTHCRQLDDRIRSWANGRDLPFLSLLPVISALFREHRAVDIMLKDDGHPTKVTHAALERVLRPWIADHLASVNGSRTGIPHREEVGARVNE